MVVAAASFDTLVHGLQNQLNITIIMVTHDLDTLSICNRIAVLVDKKLTMGTLLELREDPHPWIQQYFHGARAERLLQTKHSYTTQDGS